MKNLSRWLKLYDKDKDLISHHLSWNDEEFDAWLVNDDCGEFETNEDSPIVEALIRDQAALVGANKFGMYILKDDHTNNWIVRQYESGCNYCGIGEIARHKDPTEAWYLAFCYEFEKIKAKL